MYLEGPATEVFAGEWVIIVTTETKLLTFEEWQKLPETKQKYEIVDGVMYGGAWPGC